MVRFGGRLLFHVQNDYGYSAIMLAARRGHTQAVEALATAGANLNLQVGRLAMGAAGVGI